jgi:hypothetical protein
MRERRAVTPASGRQSDFRDEILSINLNRTFECLANQSLAAEGGVDHKLMVPLVC